MLLASYSITCSSPWFPQGPDAGPVPGFHTAALWDPDEPRQLTQTLLCYPLNLAGAGWTPKSAGPCGSPAHPGPFPQAGAVPPGPGLLPRPQGCRKHRASKGYSKAGDSRPLKAALRLIEDMIINKTGLRDLALDSPHSATPGSWGLTQLRQMLSREALGGFKHHRPQNDAHRPLPLR